MRFIVVDKKVWVEAPLADGWRARGRMEVVRNRPVVVELQILWPKAAPVPGGGITQDVVRQVPLRGFGTYLLACASFADRGGIGGLRQHFESTVGRALPKLKALAPARPRPRRESGRDDLFYARLADEYLSLLARGSRSPIKDIAAVRGESAARIRDMVHEARERDLLTKSKPGQRGGELQPRAIALLGRAR
jgi:hypothetical protein